MKRTITPLTYPMSLSPSRYSMPKTSSQLTAEEHIHQILKIYNNLPDTAAFKQQEAILLDAFPFKLDFFQKKALSALVRSKNVILSAPTGAGKTVVAELSIYLSLCRGKRAFYTAPIKALCNQKYTDLQKLLGKKRVGIMTGDVVQNRNADVIVMTAEVYRNIVLSENSTTQSSSTPLIHDLSAVVLDEFHYIDDSRRGTVWEESVIFTPPHVTIVALSATMSNPKDIKTWFLQVNGPTQLIISNHRPVPLKFQFFDSKGLMPLLDSKRLTIQPNTSTDKYVPEKDKNKTHAWSLPEKDDMHPHLWNRYMRREGRPCWYPPPEGTIEDLIKELQHRKQLPCLMFVLNRQQCDDFASSESGHVVVTPEEQQQIESKIEEFKRMYPEAAFLVKPYLKYGYASHHSGLLPTVKTLIEDLFKDGLLKVVFATETLAAGVNMPARTTVITELQKGPRRKVRWLTTNQVMQMAGRAGRRGLDKVGYTVFMQSEARRGNRMIGPLDAVRILKRGPECLRSHFSPSFGMVLNLLSNRSLEMAQQIFSKSFRNHVTNMKERCTETQQEKFMSLVKVLQHYEFLNSNYGVTEKGILGKKVHVSNQLWTGIVLSDPQLDNTTPAGLALIIGALVNDYEWEHTRCQDSVLDLARHFSGKFKEFEEVQNRFGCTQPVSFRPYNLGYVHNWVEGFYHKETDDTNSFGTMTTKAAKFPDSQDCYLLRRVLDILRQMEDLPIVSDVVKRNSKIAIEKMNRFPVTDGKTYVI